MTDNDAFRPRILLAEDEPDHQKVISAMLRKARADVTIVENGQSAVACALQAQEEENAFDLILMDIRMPVMDGCLATRRLREAGYRLPIVAMTAHAMAGDREKFIAAGCNGYISKPIDVSALLNLVKSWADGSRPRPSSEFRSFVMDGETCEITMEESGQLVAYRVHSTCVALFFERKGLVPSQVVASGPGRYRADAGRRLAAVGRGRWRRLGPPWADGLAQFDVIEWLSL